MTDTFDLVTLAIEANVPLILWGSPGIGKTTRLNAYAEVRKANLETEIASLHDPTDFSGQPKETKDGITFVPPSWANRAQAAAREGIASWVFFDEITTAPPAVQAALLRVILERKVGELDMGAEVRMIAAANPPEEAAGGWGLEPPIANRFAHFELRPSSEAWATVAIQGYPAPKPLNLPEGWEKAIPETRATVAAFVKATDSVFRMPKDGDERGRAWPSPRSWESGIRLMTAAQSVGWSEETQVSLLAACVGFGVASEYMEWLHKMDLPDPRVVLGDVEKYELAHKDRVDKNYAVLAACSSIVMRDLQDQEAKDSTYFAFWKLLAKYAKAGMGDLAASFVGPLLTANRETKNYKTKQEDLMSFKEMLKKAGLMP